jgi:acyl transferase domain-containing protein
MFRLIKALLDSGYETLKLEWSIITVGTQSIGKNDRVNPTHASLHGLIGSMAKEYPNWKVRLVDMEDGCRWPIKDILSMPFDSQGNPIAYRCGEWYRQKLVTVRSIHSKQAAYKMGGVYVVIGGAGGIGESWTEYMIRTYKANVVWIGRSEEDEAIRRKVDKLAAFGPAPYYIRADASNYDELKKVYGKIKGMYSHINGIIPFCHSTVGSKSQEYGRRTL